MYTARISKLIWIMILIFSHPMPFEQGCVETGLHVLGKILQPIPGLEPCISQFVA